jgi:hypothetical protein
VLRSRVAASFVNHTLVKDGWCWWYRKFAPGDTVLEGLETEMGTREARKGLWGDRTKTSQTFLKALGFSFTERTVFIDFTPAHVGQPDSPRSLNPSTTPGDQMDYDQHDSDHEQNPGNLDRDRCHSGKIQGTGNQADYQKHECKVEHGLLLSMKFDANKILSCSARLSP